MSKVKSSLLLVGLTLLAGCSAQQPPQSPPLRLAAVVPTPTATQKPTPVPTLTSRQKRKLRAAKRRAERAERKRLARVKKEQQRQKQERLASVHAAETSPYIATQLASKYVEGEDEIQRMTTKAHEMLSEDGIHESTDSIMEAMNDALPHRLLSDSGENHQRYAEYVALYVTQRKAGSSRSDIIGGLKVLTE